MSERPEIEADHKLLPSAKDRKKWMYTSTTAYGSMACTGELIEKYRERGREKTVKIKEIVGDTFIWDGGEGRVSLGRTFPGFARSSFWYEYYENENVWRRRLRGHSSTSK